MEANILFISEYAEFSLFQIDTGSRDWLLHPILCVSVDRSFFNAVQWRAGPAFPGACMVFTFSFLPPLLLSSCLLGSGFNSPILYVDLSIGV